MVSFESGGRPIELDAYEPAVPGPHPAIVLLHGSGGNIRFWTSRIAPFLTQMNVALYAPHYFDRTGTDRADFKTITDGVHYPQWLATVRDALAFVRTRPQVHTRRVAVLGISLGAFLSLSAAVDPGNLIRAVVEISGGMPDDYAPSVTAAFPPTLIVHGTDDTVVPVSQAHALAQLLQKNGVAHQTELIPGQGHWFDSAAQMRILMAIASFLGKHL